VTGDDVPDGFVLADLGAGYGSRFGPVYIDRARHRMAFRVTADHQNPVGGCHGGAMAMFADLLLMAHRAGREQGLPHSPTISLSVDFLAPAPLGAWVEAGVSVVRITTTMMFVQALMTVDGEPVARVHSIYRNLGKTGE
jgi:uncharacterized protein (TIGR00369 family)